MPSSQVYHSFSRKKCINPCCNSICRTVNVVGYMPRLWQFQSSPNNLPPWRGTSACFMVWKAQDHFQNTYEKKIGEWFQYWGMQWLTKNANFVRITCRRYHEETAYTKIYTNFIHNLPKFLSQRFSKFPRIFSEYSSNFFFKISTKNINQN